MKTKQNHTTMRTTFALLFALLCLMNVQTFAQGVGISESSITPDASAILELRSASRGLILPRLATGSIASPVRGLLIYNGTTDGNLLSFYNGSWITLAPLASPTFTGTVTLPTPFTIGATSMTSTGTQLNYLNAATGTTGTASTNLVFSASPTFSGTVTVPTPFTIGATSMTSTGTQLNYLNAATGTTGTASTNLVFSASPTFTGTVTVPTPFTIGATSMTSTGTQLNYLNAATGTTGTTSSSVVFSASPTFTGTVTVPTPFTLGATSVTSTGTQLNYLNAATGTTGTASTNLVYSTAPTLTGVTLAAGTNSVDPLTFTSGTNLTTAAAGAVEYDGAAFYMTPDATTGRAQTANQQIFRLTANGAAVGPAIADYFGANSAIPTVASGVYELTFYLYYLKSTAGTVTYTLTNTSVYTNIVADYLQSAAAGIAATGNQGGAGIVGVTAAAAALPATSSLTTAVNHRAVVRAIAECNAAGTIRLRVTCSAGTLTPLRGSYYTVRRLSSGNVGTFAP
ncbi:MAG: hypothetical protein ACOYNS_08175 [Bacteroidota bacterium]